MVDTDTWGFIEVVLIGVIVGSILLLVFCFLRPKVPDVFNHRALLNTWRSYNDFNGNRVGLIDKDAGSGFFAWLKPVLYTSPTHIVHNIGLDAAMFLRFIRTGLIVTTIISIFGSLVLMPTYGTGGNKNLVNTSVEFTEGLQIITLGNVPSSDGRLWAAVVAEFLVAAVVLYFFTMDFSFYAKFRRIYRNSENPVNYSIVVHDIPKDFLSEQAIRERFELLVPNQIVDVILVRNGAKAMKLQKKLDAAVTKREVAEYVEATKGKSPETRPGACGCLMLHKPKENAVHYWQSEQTRLTTEIAAEGKEANLCTSAIITLANKRAASLLVQANVATSATSWKIERTAEPEAIYWPAFTIPGYQVEVRALAVFVFMIVFTLFWTIPATAIAGLFSLKQLSELKGFSWAANILEWNPAISGLIQGALPPLVMVVLISLIPSLFRFVISQERLVSLGAIERKTRDYFFFFTVYGSFLIIVLGASALKNMDEIIKEPQQLINALATNVPGTGIFFANFIMIKTLIPLPLALSGVIRVIIRWIMMKLAKTERQKRKARSGGGIFQYFRQYGGSLLVLFLGIMFSSLSPIVPVCAMVYFALASLVFRYTIFFGSYNPWDGGGDMFPGAYWATMVGLILKQLIVITVLGLKKGAAESVICIIPLLITIGVSLIISRRYQRISEHGSLHDMYEDSAKLHEIPVQYNGIYDPPAGKVEHYENLNGIEDIHDVYSEVDDTGKLNNLPSEHHDESVGYVPDRTAKREEV